MTFLSEIPLIGGTLAVAIPFLIVLSVVVFVHEFGHYIVGRWCGIHAEVFSIGFGKRLFGWTDGRGTHWQVALLPLGGYVKFVGDMDPASAGAVRDDDLTPDQRAHAFHFATLPARAATVVAGPLANFLLSILLFAAIILAMGNPSNEPRIGRVTADAPAGLGLQAGDQVLAIDGQPVADFAALKEKLARPGSTMVPATVQRGADRLELMLDLSRPAVVAGLSPEGAAGLAGVLPGDVILAINDTPVTNSRDVLILPLSAPVGEPITLRLRRGEGEVSVSVMPKMTLRTHPLTGVEANLPTLGMTFVSFGGIEMALDPVDPLTALAGGAGQVWTIIATTMTHLHAMVFEGGDSSQLGGPIRIAEVSGQAAERGLSDFIWLIGVLSTSIGLLNLFPIPILDGGHLMFYLVEAVRGRPVGGAAIRVGTMIGLSLVLLLMGFATYNDLLRT